MSVIEGTYDLRVHVGAPGAGTSEVQTLTIGGTPTGGTFKIAYDGQISGAITWSATTNTLLANINAALDAMANIGTGGCVATDSTLSSGVGNVLLTFAANLAKLAVNTMTINTNALTGSAPTLAIAETTPGVTATERGAGIGALLVNISNGAVYSNTGTALAPTWTLIGTVAGGSVTATELASNAVTTVKILDANVTLAKLEPGSASAGITGTALKFIADANVIGGVPVIHRVDITAGANANVDVVLTHKTRVINAWLVLRGAGVTSETFQVKNGANAITDAMAASGSDQAVVRCASLNDAYWEIAAGGTLRVTGASGASMPDATIFVEGIRVA